MNRFDTNAFGMRSTELPAAKTAKEFRVLALGDSVLNGGNLADQDDLATSLLTTGERRVLNASAGSWGPPNELNYVREFGWFDADATIIVLSSHDAQDVPTFAPLNPLTHPTKNPRTAIFAFAARYGPKFPNLGEIPPAPPGKTAYHPVSALPDLEELLKLASHRGPVCAILDTTQHELQSQQKDPGYQAIATVARETAATVVELSNFLDKASSYRDDIHLSKEGQRQLASAMLSCIK